jgi:hypothetical protein
MQLTDWMIMTSHVAHRVRSEPQLSVHQLAASIPGRPASAHSARNIRERLLLVARCEADARIEAEMAALDNEELCNDNARLQSLAEAERVAKYSLQQQLHVRH